MEEVNFKVSITYLLPFKVRKGFTIIAQDESKPSEVV